MLDTATRRPMPLAITFSGRLAARAALALGALLLLATVAALPARGDWLKTHDGAMIETRGPWKVKGSIVVFTTPGGTLSSLRLSEVDVDASAVATVEAKAGPSKPEPVPEPPREPVLVVTNEDVGPARVPAASPAEDDDDGEEGAPDPPRGQESDVQVVSWRTVENADLGGIEIQGTLQNRGRDIVTDLRVVVQLLGENGGTIDRANAFLGSVSLAPTSTTRLRAVFPDVVNTAVAEAKFQVRSNAIKVQGVVEPTEPGNES